MAVRPCVLDSGLRMFGYGAVPVMEQCNYVTYVWRICEGRKRGKIVQDNLFAPYALQQDNL